ncbi:MAG TPA: CGNR zinc finger domain-containing protein [Nitriliruptoraceae bacterium]|nr:CGNR zinc finger domain-containing protein [Nitriliruptoraceae bacterium]
MDFDRYANTAGELAADLVNLLVVDDDAAHASEEDVRVLLGGYDLALEVHDGSIGALRDLAQQSWRVFDAPDLATAITVLNELLDGTPTAPRISTHGDRGPHLHVEPRDASTLQRLRANTLMGLAAVLCDGGRLRLGACDAHDCRRVFVDTSRNARRRFCSTRCSTRHHVAAHRARQDAS